MTKTVIRLTALVGVGFFLLVPLAATAAATASGAVVVATPKACQAAATKLQAGNLARAAEAYAAVKPQDQSCVRQGTTAVSALLQARQLIAVGMGAAAGDAIERALAADPTLSLSDALFPQKIGQNGVALAKKLDSDGFHAQAVQLLYEVVRDNPQISLDRQAQDILGLIGVPWYVRAWRWIISPTGLSIVIPALLVVARIVIPKLRRRLYLQKFAGGKAAETQPDHADDLHSRVKAELLRLAAESVRMPDGRPLRLDLAGPYEGTADLDKVTDGLPLAVKALCWILAALGSRSRLANGRLMPGISVAVSLDTMGGGSRGSKIIDFGALDFPPPERGAISARIAQLALPAAAWLLLNYDKKATLGGTRDWGSYVDFAAGYAWQVKSDRDRLYPGRDVTDWRESRERAKFHYERACGDTGNAAAAVNLSALLRAEETEARLNGVQPLEREDDPSASAWYRLLRPQVANPSLTPSDLLWYRVRYVLPLYLRDHLDFFGSDGLANLTNEALRDAAQLAVELGHKSGDPGRIPESFVDSSLPAALTLTARLAIPETDNPLEIFTSEPAYLADLPIEEVLDRLRDGPLKGAAELLVAHVTENYPLLPAEAEYNLFCYHQEREEICKDAIEDIEDEQRIEGYRDDFANQDVQSPEVLASRLRIAEEVATARASQLERLERLRSDEHKLADQYSERARASQDPVMRARVSEARRFERARGRQASEFPYSHSPQPPVGNGSVPDA